MHSGVKTSFLQGVGGRLKESVHQSYSINLLVIIPQKLPRFDSINIKHFQNNQCVNIRPNKKAKNKVNI